MATEHVIEIVGKNKSALEAIEQVKRAIAQLKQEVAGLAEEFKLEIPEPPKTPKVKTPKAEPKKDVDRSKEVQQTKEITKSTQKSLDAILDKKEALAELAELRRQEKLDLVRSTASYAELAQVTERYYKAHSMGEKAYRNIARDEDKLAERFGKMGAETQQAFIREAENVLRTEGLKLDDTLSAIEKKWKATVEKIESYGLKERVRLQPFGEVRKVIESQGLDDETLKQYKHVIDKASRQADVLGPTMGSEVYSKQMAQTQKSFMNYVSIFNQLNKEVAYTEQGIAEFNQRLKEMDFSNLKQLQEQFKAQAMEMNTMLQIQKMFDTRGTDEKKQRLITAFLGRLQTQQSLLAKLGRGPGVSAIDFERVAEKLEVKDLDKVARLTDDMNRKVRLLRVEIEKTAEAATPVTETIGRVGKAASWFLATTAIMGLLKALRFTVGTMSSMQIAVIDLQKVMDEATTDFYEMRQAAFDLGKELGRLPEEAMKAMGLFARQGREQAEVIEMTRVALVATNIAEMSLTESVEQLTATILQWGLEAADAMRILDAWNEVSNRNAVTASALAEAFSHTSTMAKQLGLDIHELNALITILAANTGKSGGEIGRALRFAFNRVFLPVVQTTLSNILGIGVFEPGTGELRDFSGILREVADAWSELSDAQKAAIARAFGGTRHVQDMHILFEHLGTMGVKVATDSLYSFNSAIRENERYMASLDRQLASLQTGFKEVAITLGDAGVFGIIQMLIDATKLVVGAFNAIPAPLRHLVAAMVLAKVAQAGLSKVFGEFPFTVDQARGAITNLIGSLIRLGVALKSGEVAVNLANISSMLVGLKTAILGALGPWGIATIALLGAGFVWKGLKAAHDKFTESIDDQIAKINEMTRHYEGQAVAAERYGEIIEQIELGSLSESQAIEKKTRVYNDFRKTFGALYKDYDDMSKHIDAYIELKRSEADEVAKLSEDTKVILEENLESELGFLDEELNKRRKVQREIIDLANKARAEGDLFLNPEVSFRLEMEGMMTGRQSFLRDVYSTLRTFGFKAGEEGLMRLWSEIFAQMIDGLEQLEQKAKKTEQSLQSLQTIGQTPFERFSEAAMGDPIGRFGHYATALSQLLTSTLEFKNELKEVVDHLNEQTSQVKELVDLYKTYWETTGQGFAQYAEIYERTEVLFDDLMRRRYLVAKTIVDKTPYEQTSYRSYYLALRQAIEAQEHFAKQLDDQRDALRKAFDAGIIGAMDFYSKLVEIDRLDVFSRKRKQIREMTEELKTGTVSAIESFIKGSIMGEEKALEQFQESIKSVRSGVLAKGLTGWITESDYFQTQMARQQHLIATLFGAGAAEKTISIEDRQLASLKIQEGLQQGILDETRRIADEARRAADELKSLSPPGPGRPGIIGELNNVLEQVNALVQRGLSLGNAFESATEGVVDFGNTLVEAERGIVDVVQSLSELEVAWAEDGVPLPKEPLSWLDGGVVPLPEALRWVNDGIVPLPQGELSWVESGIVPLPAEVLSWANSGIVPLPEERLSWAGEGVVPLPEEELSWADEGLVPYPQRPLNWADAFVTYPREELKWRESLVEVPSIQQFELKIEGQPAIKFSPDPYPIRIESQPQVGWEYAGKDVSESTLPLLIPPPPPDLENQMNAAYGELSGVMVGLGEFGISLQDMLRLESEKTLASMGIFFSSMKAQFDLMTELMRLSQLSPEEIDMTPQEITIEIEDENLRNQTKSAFDRLGKIFKLPFSTAVKDTALTIGTVLGSGALTWALFQILGIPGGAAFGHASGGHTGPGGKLEPAGIVHKGEWVAPQWLVKKYPDLVAMMEGVRQRGYQAGGYTTGGWEARLSRQYQWQVNERVYEERQRRLLSDVSRDLRLGQKEGWDYGVFVLGRAIGPYVDKIVKPIDGVRNEVVDIVNFVTGETLANKLEYKTMGIPGVQYFGRAGGSAIKYGAGTALKGMGLLHYVGMAMYLVQLYDSFKRELGGAGLKRLIGFDVLFGDKGSIFQSGGFTGLGGLSEIAGVVHKGEWVAPAWQVQKYPHLIKTLEAIRKRGYQSGGGDFQLQPSSLRVTAAEPINAEGYLSEMLKSISKIELEVANIGVDTEAQVKESKSLGQRMYEFVFGARGETQMDKYRKMFEERGYEGKMADEAIRAVQVVAGDASPTQLTKALDIMISKGLIPTEATFAELVRILIQNFDKFAKEFEPKDKAFYERLQVGRERLEIKTVGQALGDPTQLQDAVASMTMMMAETDSSLASNFGFLAGLIRGTDMEVQLASSFEKIGLKNLPSDIISGMGMIFGGMSQNVKEAGSGMANIITGLASATGIGGPWVPLLSPLLQTLFGRPKEKAKEAEKIGNVRHFIQSGDAGYQMADRFYLSGRHAALLRGETTGPVWGEGVSQRFDRVEINISGAGDPQAVAQEVKRVLTSDIPRSYSREMRRGLYR